MGLVQLCNVGDSVAHACMVSMQDSLPAVERLQSLRLSLDRDRTSAEFMPWTSAVDPRISKQDWEEDAEYAIR